MQRMSEKFVPQLHTTQQKQWCVSVGQELQDEVRNDQLPTGDHNKR
jgi:hypothetical protein